MDIRLKLDPDADDEAVVRNGLRAYNTATAGPTSYQPVAILLHDNDGKPVGGLTGSVLYDWLYIELFHVPAELRGKGHGRALMARAEAFVREQRLIGIWLDTFTFQARPFYEKLGFTVFGTLEGHPAGGARYFLSKRIDQTGDIGQTDRQ
jgi:GNAT superfamily N-acetyltransferase